MIRTMKRGLLFLLLVSQWYDYTTFVVIFQILPFRSSPKLEISLRLTGGSQWRTKEGSVREQSFMLSFPSAMAEGSAVCLSPVIPEDCSRGSAVLLFRPLSVIANTFAALSVNSVKQSVFVFRFGSNPSKNVLAALGLPHEPFHKRKSGS